MKTPNQEPDGAEWRPGPILALIVVAVAAAIAASSVFLIRMEPPAPLPQASSAPVPRPRAEPSVEPPAGPGPFHGRTHREDGSLVMQITFPDGTRAEVVYPATRELGIGHVSPRAYVRGPRICEYQMGFTRSDPVGGLIANQPPLAVFEGAGGDPVALWPGKRGPWHVLAFDFGPWTGVLFCEADPDSDAEDLSVWARSIDAQVTSDGLLLLDVRPPLRLLSGDQVGPSVTLANGEPRDLPMVELSASGCSPAPVERAGGTAHGCFEGGIELYAMGGPRFLEAVVDGLGVRSVRASRG